MYDKKIPEIRFGNEHGQIIRTHGHSLDSLDHEEKLARRHLKHMTAVFLD